ncbi:hypothetical protein EVAR_37911_1 [Eumeta japonica]|uniref:Uncharacterized protein n=1 Tax=Eumeta variegata TaxID=151549 RepID=A0A4C1XBV6_EUMVA|nr:hypothetical protein EVAR_37911_1 [Eumeta japonica]
MHSTKIIERHTTLKSKLFSNATNAERRAGGVSVIDVAAQGNGSYAASAQIRRLGGEVPSGEREPRRSKDDARESARGSNRDTGPSPRPFVTRK